LRWFDLVPAYQSNIEMLLCAGDILSRTLSDRLRSRVCSHLVAHYGSTETSMSAAAHAHEIVATPRAVGFVTPGVTIQIVDSSGALLPAGAEGHVRVKSEYAVSGYFGKSGRCRNLECRRSTRYSGTETGRALSGRRQDQP
jgi:acyl-coenzyme A synthetase/AMP-(fatty) acid ligase